MILVLRWETMLRDFSLQRIADIIKHCFNFINKEFKSGLFLGCDTFNLGEKEKKEKKKNERSHKTLHI